MKLKDINAHNRDIRVKFDKEPHLYYVDGKKYDISVTGFVKLFFQEFNADSIIEKNYQKWQENKDSKYYGLDINKIKRIWSENAKESSKLGSILHNDIELFQNNIHIKNETVEFQYFLNFNERVSDKLIPYRTEWIIFDERIKLAGSIDMCYKDKNGNTILIDWKRSKKISKENSFRSGKKPLNHIPDSNFWHYSLQLNMYKYILEKNYDINVSSMHIVKLHPNQDNYSIITIPNLQKEINLMIEHRNTVC